MRFWIFKIIYVISSYTYHMGAIYANEYDFDFDVNKSKVSREFGENAYDTEDYVDSLRLGMQASLLPDFLKGSGEFVYDGLADDTSAGFSDFGKYLFVLGVSGERSALSYGLNYYSVGQKHEGKFNSKYRNNKGRTGYDSWMAWNFDKLLVKTTYMESWTSNPRITNQIRTLERRYEVETSYPLSVSPFTEISVAYSVGKRKRTFIPDDILTYDGPLSSLRTAFDLSAKYVNFSSGYNQSSSRNELGDLYSFKQDLVYVKGALFPKHPLSMTSSYRYSVNRHSSPVYYNNINKMETSLGFIYKPIEIPALLKLTSAYKKQNSDDDLTYRDIVNLGARIDWKLRGRNTGLYTDWTVDMQYKDVTDFVDPTRDASFWSFNLSLRWPFS